MLGQQRYAHTIGPCRVDPTGDANTLIGKHFEHRSIEKDMQPQQLIRAKGQRRDVQVAIGRNIQTRVRPIDDQLVQRGVIGDEGLLSSVGGTPHHNAAEALARRDELDHQLQSVAAGGT